MEVGKDGRRPWSREYGPQKMSPLFHNSRTRDAGRTDPSLGSRLESD